MRSDMGRKRYGTPEYYQCPARILLALRGVGHVRVLAGGEGLDRVARLGERLGLRGIAHREAFGIDELDVVDTDEAQEIAYVRGLRVERGSGVDAATGREDIGFLPGDETLRPLLRVAEGLPGARDMVEVGFQRRRHAEVVHRQPQHDHVSLAQLVDEGIRE